MKTFLGILIFLTFSISAFALDTLYFPVTHHIFAKNDGSGSLQNAKVIPIIMQELNRVFAEINVQFYMSCVGIDTIKNTSKYNFVFDSTCRGCNEYYLSNTAGTPNTINIFYVNSIKMVHI